MARASAVLPYLLLFAHAMTPTLAARHSKQDVSEAQTPSVASDARAKVKTDASNDEDELPPDLLSSPATHSDVVSAAEIHAATVSKSEAVAEEPSGRLSLAVPFPNAPEPNNHNGIDPLKPKPVRLPKLPPRPFMPQSMEKSELYPRPVKPELVPEWQPRPIRPVRAEDERTRVWPPWVPSDPDMPWPLPLPVQLHAPESVKAHIHADSVMNVDGNPIVSVSDYLTRELMKRRLHNVNLRFFENLLSGESQVADKLWKNVFENMDCENIPVVDSSEAQQAAGCHARANLYSAEDAVAKAQLVQDELRKIKRALHIHTLELKVAKEELRETEALVIPNVFNPENLVDEDMADIIDQLDMELEVRRERVAELEEEVEEKSVTVEAVEKQFTKEVEHAGFWLARANFLIFGDSSTPSTWFLNEAND